MNLLNQNKDRFENLDQLVAQRTKELQSANEQLKKEIAERIQAQESLRLSEERFSKAFQASPIPLAIQSLLNERFVDANAGFLRLTGYGRNELIGQTARQLGIWENSEDECTMLEKLGQEMSVRDRPCKFRAKTDRVLDILLSVELIELDGQPFLLAIAQDITEQIKLENQLRQAQKMEAVGQLAAGVAHDFNNILTVVQGNASLLLAGKPPGSPDCRPLQSICAAAEQAAKLVGQLLTFCRKQVVELRPIQLRVHLRRRHRDAASRPDAPSRWMPTRRPACRWFARTPRMMETLLMNLAVNARDAMPEGGQLSITAEP
jgi:PAS domain S-box-containing protein